MPLSPTYRHNQGTTPPVPGYYQAQGTTRHPAFCRDTKQRKPARVELKVHRELSPEQVGALKSKRGTCVAVCAAKWYHCSDLEARGKRKWCNYYGAWLVRSGERANRCFECIVEKGK